MGFPTILHAQQSQVNVVMSGERQKLFENRDNPVFISSLYPSYSLNRILKIEYWASFTLTLHICEVKQCYSFNVGEREARRCQWPHRTRKLIAETGLQNIKAVIRLDCPVLPHCLSLSIARKQHAHHVSYCSQARGPARGRSTPHSPQADASFSCTHARTGSFWICRQLKSSIVPTDYLASWDFV